MQKEAKQMSNQNLFISSRDRKIFRKLCVERASNAFIKHYHFYKIRHGKPWEGMGRPTNQTV